MNITEINHQIECNRQPIMSRRGAVATSQPLAARAGVSMLERGGNAFDAALAAAAALTVVEPTSNGLGGDCFVLYSRRGNIGGLNSSGWLPYDYPEDKIENHLIRNKKLDRFGWGGVTVPGQIAGWNYLGENFARLDWEDIFRPACIYAREGFPVSPVVAYNWDKALKKYRENLSEDHKKSFFNSFSLQKMAPESGEIWKNISQAETLERLAAEGLMDFYQGEIAEKIVEYADRTGGYISREDLEDFSPLEVEPLKINYNGHQIYELPPNGQGLIALQALKIMNDINLHNFKNCSEMHLRIEALKQAFADGKEFIGDPKKMEISPEKLLSNNYLNQKRDKITSRASKPEPGPVDRGGTVYLAAGDNQGNLVSLIQSNYTGFGSGVVIPGTGISLHNRGHNFSVDEEKANVPAPGRRPYHTIIPGFIRSNRKNVAGPFGVMGGFMQPQGHVQVLQNMIDYGMNPQEALTAPRWRWQEEKKLLLEPGFNRETARELSRRGHEVKIEWKMSGYGRGQIIFMDRDRGCLIGASEPRADGQVAVY